MEKKFCEQCQREGKTSTIYVPQTGYTTLMAPAPAYYDEQGVYHQPKDPNYTTYEYSCSNGHTWKETV
jgi:hypothetical protein